MGKRDLEKEPWIYSFEGMRKRCNYSKYENYNCYGGRGIKALLTKQDMAYLWSRDKAHLLKHPTIDRIDNDGDYVLENCRFVERSFNSSRVGGCPAKMGWSHKFKKCIRCGTNKVRHRNKGLCHNCDMHDRYRIKNGLPLNYVQKKFKWSRDYPKCVVCSENKKRHMAFGLCGKCYKKKGLRIEYGAKTGN